MTQTVLTIFGSADFQLHTKLYMSHSLRGREHSDLQIHTCKTSDLLCGRHDFCHRSLPKSHPPCKATWQDQELYVTSALQTRGKTSPLNTQRWNYIAKCATCVLDCSGVQPSLKIHLLNYFMIVT